MINQKCRVGVLFGGQSSEHEVSLRSAASVMQFLDRTRFEVVPIGIAKTGEWLLHDMHTLRFDDNNAVLFSKKAEKLNFSFNGRDALLSLVDVIFPAVHGNECENGVLQAFIEMLGVPYVGAGVAGSAVMMDKVLSNRMAESMSIAVPAWMDCHRSTWQHSQSAFLAMVIGGLSFPMFVKPVTTGSSIGVSKVHNRAQLIEAIETAFQYDVRVIVEEGVDGREIEISVLENIQDVKNPLVSLPGEIKPTGEFYSYAAKYLDKDGAVLAIPAELSEEIVVRIQMLARILFPLLGGEGMGRVDFLLDEKAGICYFNEINSLPGFTSISLYPKLWEISGISYTSLLTKLIDLALVRRERTKVLKKDFAQELALVD